MVKSFLAAIVYDCYYSDMSQQAQTLKKPALDKYPAGIIIIRWLFTALEIGLAAFFIFDFSFKLGILYLMYAIVCGFLLLPLIRCVRCAYYGKRCNFGWGVWVARYFPKADNSHFASAYGFSFLFWPLRFIPIGLCFIAFIDLLIGGFKPVPHGMVIAYFLVLFIHRKFYRTYSCTVCLETDKCPVHDCNAVLACTTDNAEYKSLK